MGRAPCCSKIGLRRGPWSPREDTLLVIQAHGEGLWRSLPTKAGLFRCGKSCRLRWMNYLRPDIKRGNITPDEDDLIIRLHSLLGNRWSLIAGRLPGRTDNQIKNHWNTHLSKRLLSQGTDPNTHKKLPHPVVVGGTGNKKLNNANKPVNQEKPKIHFPKPIRLSSSISLPRNEKFTKTPSGQGELQVPWSDHVSDDENRTGFLSGYYDNNDQGFIKGSDFEWQSQREHDQRVPAASDEDDTNSLEKLYEEYLQLLKTNEEQVQLDSFSESLLI